MVWLCSEGRTRSLLLVIGKVPLVVGRQWLQLLLEVGQVAFLSPALAYCLVQLIYNVGIISAVQQSDSVIRIHTSILLPILFRIGYHRILGSIHCAVQPLPMPVQCAYANPRPSDKGKLILLWIFSG